MFHNSWIKLQNYLPDFGGKLILQKLLEFDDIPKDVLSFAVKYSQLPLRYNLISTFNGNYIDHNSWIKLQNLPDFGGKLILQKWFEFDDTQSKAILSFPSRSSLIYKLTENEYLLIYGNLNNVVSQVEKKLRNLGVEEIIVDTFSSSR